MIVSILSAAHGNDERPPHDAAVLLGVIRQLSQLLDSESKVLCEIESWLHRLCKEHAVGKRFCSTLFQLEQTGLWCCYAAH
jgi:hypothetical protein